MKGRTTPRPAELTATATADNGAATATLSDPGDNARLYITHISASFSAAAVKKLELKFGTTVKMTLHVHNQLDLDFSAAPIMVDVSTAASAVLEASGAGGTIGAVNIAGYTGA